MAIEYNPEDVNPNQDPLIQFEEESRLAALAEYNEPTEFSPPDVDPLTDEELAVQQAYQEDQRAELARTYGPEQVGAEDPVAYPNGLPYDDDGNLNDAVNDALLNSAMDAHNQSDGNIPPDNFHLTLLNTFILNLPKALIGSVLSPKFFLPIVIVYKTVVAGVGATIKTAKEIMKVLWKLFYYVITKLLWKFISEFWKRVKRDLLLFLVDIAATILGNKTKRYRKMLLALIAILTKILENGLDNCKDLYEMINLSIDLALSGLGGGAGGGFATSGISSFMLPFFLKKPGYSEDRATINAIQKMEEKGLSTAPIFGEPNNLIKFVQSVIEGHTEEMDNSSYVAVGNKEVVIPVPGLSGPLVIPPGVILSGGGTF